MFLHTSSWIGAAPEMLLKLLPSKFVDSLHSYYSWMNHLKVADGFSPHPNAPSLHFPSIYCWRTAHFGPGADCICLLQRCGIRTSSSAGKRKCSTPKLALLLRGDHRKRRKEAGLHLIREVEKRIGRMAAYSVTLASTGVAPGSDPFTVSPADAHFNFDILSREMLTS